MWRLPIWRLKTRRLTGAALRADRRDACPAHAALAVVGAEAFAIIVAELELCELAVKVLLGAVLIDTLHAAFEDRERAFNGVRVNETADILTGLVLHLPVAEEVAVQRVASIVSRFVD